jgi:hypothetical protein
MFKWSTAEHMAGLNEDRPCGSINESSDGEAPTTLQSLNGRLGGRAKDTCFVS